MEIVILIGTGVIAVFFWVLLLLIFCNMKRVRVLPTQRSSPVLNRPSCIPIPFQPGKPLRFPSWFTYQLPALRILLFSHVWLQVEQKLSVGLSPPPP